MRFNERRDEDEDRFFDDFDNQADDGDHQGSMNGPIMDVIGKEYLSAEIGLMERDLNRRVLVMATKIAQNSFFWRFQSHTTKLKKIHEVYIFLMAMVEG